MSFNNYLEKGQAIELEIEYKDRRQTYQAQIEEAANGKVVVAVHDPSFKAEEIEPDTKGIVWGKKHGLRYSLYVVIESAAGPHSIILKHVPTRTHLRIDAYIIIEHKTITDDLYLQRRRKYIQNMTPDREGYLFTPTRGLTEEGELQATIPPELISEIVNIHRKLDLIIKLVGKSGRETVFNKEPQEVNISGSGLRFNSSTEYTPGAYLDMKLVLPVSSGILIELIGQVVRVVNRGIQERAAQEPAYETAVKFTTINEDDRECIIRYVFKRQRELLRSEEDTL